MYCLEEDAHSLPSPGEPPRHLFDADATYLLHCHSSCKRTLHVAQARNLGMVLNSSFTLTHQPLRLLVPALPPPHPHTQTHTRTQVARNSLHCADPILLSTHLHSVQTSFQALPFPVSALLVPTLLFSFSLCKQALSLVSTGEIAHGKRHLPCTCLTRAPPIVPHITRSESW